MEIFSSLTNNKINTAGKQFTVGNYSDFSELMHSNLIFDTRNKIWYKQYNRYGWINLLDIENITKEFLFFTKPDLYIYDGNDYRNASLNSTFRRNGFFIDSDRKNRDALLEIQYSIKDSMGDKNPFMRYLSNMVISKLEIPRITSDMQSSTQNAYGAKIDYRTHSVKSDYGFDFSLTFRDTSYLDIYMMVKAYDEFMRYNKKGEIDYNFKSSANKTNNTSTSNTVEIYKEYIKSHIIPEQFSIYKFIVGSDGETIVFYSKLTGVYFTDVPRDEFSEPDTTNGLKYSLSFHANFVKDSDPIILQEFNALTLASEDPKQMIQLYNDEKVNNEPAKYARIFRYANTKSTQRRSTGFEYKLKWTNIKKKGATT